MISNGLRQSGRLVFFLVLLHLLDRGEGEGEEERERKTKGYLLLSFLVRCTVTADDGSVSCSAVCANEQSAQTNQAERHDLI